MTEISTKYGIIGSSNVVPDVTDFYKGLARLRELLKEGGYVSELAQLDDAEKISSSGTEIFLELRECILDLRDSGTKYSAEIQELLNWLPKRQLEGIIYARN
jgi:hypothetical protein